MIWKIRKRIYKFSTKKSFQKAGEIKKGKKILKKSDFNRMIWLIIKVIENFKLYLKNLKEGSVSMGPI